MRRAGTRLCKALSGKHFPWLDSNGLAAVQKVGFVRVTGTGIAESLLKDMQTAQHKIAQLSIDLKDKSMADLTTLIQEDLDTESSAITTNSDKLRSLILSNMESEQLMDEAQLDARLEVKAGVGGDEALKWAQELFSMYEQVSGRLGWQFTVGKDSTDSIMKAVVSGGRGSGTYDFLRFESGVHRVQRVPFNSDRMQTSAAAVYVVPKLDIPTVTIRESDLKIFISKKSSGAGGQSVNAAYQQVRMSHIPTGFTVVVNDSHAQQENREKAYELIREKVQQFEEDKVLAAMAASRKGQVRTADRSEKVRSYNFQRSEVNDHRLTAKQGGVVKESCEDFMTDCASLVMLWERLKLQRDNELINAFVIDVATR